MKKLTLLLFSIFLSTSQAFTATSEWFDAGGGRVRLITGTIENDKIAGVLEVELRPGWKTYWRDPGSAGIPPSVTGRPETSVSAVEMAFPAPKRIIQDGLSWAGYQFSVAFPLQFSLKQDAENTPLSLQVFLGICEQVCIPVQTSFQFDPRNASERETQYIRLAQELLPKNAGDEFGIVETIIKENSLQFRAAVPEGEAELFIANPKGWVLGTPKLKKATDGTTMFETQIHHRPSQGDLALPTMEYTLAVGGKAVSGAATITE